MDRILKKLPSLFTSPSSVPFFVIALCGTLVAAPKTSEASGNSTSNVVVYPKIDRPEFDYNVPVYILKAGDKVVPIRHYNPHNNDSVTRTCYYAHFGVSGGPVTIEIDAKEPIANFSIRPAAYQIQGTVKGSKLTFSLPQSRYLSVSINGRKDLFLLADPNESDRPSNSGTDPASGKKVFNIANSPFQADATGKNLATDAIKLAIEEAAKEEKGGIVYIPAGQYIIGGMSLKSKVWLYLEPGAVLVANPDRTKWENDKIKPVAMINCRGIQNAKIYGRGVIYCRGAVGANELKALKVSKPDIYGPYHTLRLRPFSISGVKNFTIDGVLINESSAWTLYIEKGDGINITNAKVVNVKLNSGTNDGINIGGGINITARHCFITTLDDAVCLKGIMGNVNNVLLEDFVADSARSAIKFGMQGVTSVNNVTVRDFHGTMSSKGLDISHDMGQADYRNFRILDSTFDRSGIPLRITIRDNAKNWGGKGRGVASVVGLELNNVDFIVDENSAKFSMSGYDPDNIVRDVTLNNVKVNGKLLSPSDVGQGKEKLIEIGPYVANVKVQGQAIAIAPWPPKKPGKGTPPPSQSRAGKNWEEKQAEKAAGNAAK